LHLVGLLFNVKSLQFLRHFIDKCKSLHAEALRREGGKSRWTSRFR